MKQFHVYQGTQIKDSNTSSKMMYHLVLSLLPIILFAWYQRGIVPYMEERTDIIGLFYPLLFLLLPSLITYLMEVLFHIHHPHPFKDAFFNYGFVIGLFLGLILPFQTPVVILIIASLFSSLIGKLIFGGFGCNIFNPALIGYLFVLMSYGAVMSVDVVSSATPLTNFKNLGGIGNYHNLVEPYGNLWNFFFGTIPGTLGETSGLLCILAYFYLCIKKVIKWKIPLIYVGTVFGMTFLIGGYQNLDIWFPIFQVLSGGLLFGAVFMATDPVTSPTTPIGQILYALFLGILTVFFRFGTSYPEGVMFSILIMNLFVFILDQVGSKSRFNFTHAIIPFFLAWTLILGLGVYFGLNVGKEKTDSNFHIISKEKNQNEFSYIVEQKGYAGNIKARIVIQNYSVSSFEVLEQNESYYKRVEKADYIEKLLENQKHLEQVDTISGATKTSTALKNMLIHTLEDYEKEVHS